MDPIAANMAQWNRNEVTLDLPDADSRTRLEAVAKEFESLFAKQMLDSMRDTLNPDDDMFNGGMGQDIFEDMLYEEYARMLSQEGGLGIADMIVEQLGDSVAGPVSPAAARRAADAYGGV